MSTQLSTQSPPAAPAYSAAVGPARDAPLAVDFTVEPCEAGRVLYQRLAPAVAGQPTRGMLYLLLTVTNGTGAPLRLESVDVSFPGSALPAAHFPRGADLEPGTHDVKMDGAHVVQLTAFPPTVRVRLRLDDGRSVSREWPLAAHATSYPFFAEPEPDGDYGECLYLPGIHAKTGGGEQHFGYDVGAYGWNRMTGTLSKYRTDGAKNTDFFLWERPIYAMADGVVLRAVGKHPDNPSPDERSFRRTDGSYESAYRVTAVAAAGLADEKKQRWSRLAVAAAAEDGNMRLVVLEQSQDGDELRRVAEATGPAAEQVSVARVPASRLVTAARAGTTVTLTLWRIPADSTTLTALGTATFSNVTDVRVVGLSSDRVLTVCRTTAGTLNLAAWDCTGLALGTAPLGVAGAGAVAECEAVALGPTRVVTAVRQDDGQMKLIVWDLEPLRGGGVAIARRGDALGGPASEVALSNTELDGCVTAAARRPDGTVHLTTWQVDGAGELTVRGAAATGDPGTLVQIGLFKTKALAAAFRTPDGDLRVVSWDVKQDRPENAVSHYRLYTQGAGPVDRVAVAQVLTDQTTFVTAVRTQEGRLKVILWQCTDSNLIYLLYGNEMVCHIHLRQGSIPDALLADAPVPVKRGDLIGRMGHSGRSADPHLHIHALRVRDELLGDLPALRARVAAGETVGAFRPLHFRGVQGMRADAGDVKRGVGRTNPLTTFDGHGGYFGQYVVWPWAGEHPSCGSLRAAIAELDAQIAETGDHGGIEGEPSPAPGAKPGVYGAVAELVRRRNALRVQADARGCTG